MNKKTAILYSMLAMPSMFGYPIIENESKKSLICPNCKKEHFDTRGYCSKDCFIEHKKKGEK